MRFQTNIFPKKYHSEYLYILQHLMHSHFQQAQNYHYNFIFTVDHDSTNFSKISGGLGGGILGTPFPLYTIHCY